MNAHSFHSSRHRPDASGASQVPRPRFSPGTVRLDADLLFDAIAQLLANLGLSAPAVVAGMLHENVRSLIHHVTDIAAATCWAADFFLLSLAARAIARSLRQRRASRQGGTGSID